MKTAILSMTRYLLVFWVIIIRFFRRDGRVVQGVALELLCRLLFTEGSNPSLSVSSDDLRFSFEFERKSQVLFYHSIISRKKKS